MKRNFRHDVWESSVRVCTDELASLLFSTNHIDAPILQTLRWFDEPHPLIIAVLLHKPNNFFPGTENFVWTQHLRA